MGSSQSQPNRPPPPSASEAGAAAPAPPRPPLLGHSSTLRRLSQYARGESSGSIKRNRTAPSLSSSSSRLDRSKKPRISPEDHPSSPVGDGRSEMSMRTPDTIHSASLATPGTVSTDLSTPGLPTSPGPPIGETSMAPPPPRSPRGDPLRVERARSIASIRSVLGDDWIPPTDPTTALPNTAPLPETRIRPTSTPTPTPSATPTRPRRSSLPSLPSPSSRSGGGEMTAYLGFSAPVPDSISPASPGAAASASAHSSAAAGDRMDLDGPNPLDGADETPNLTTLAEAERAVLLELAETRANIARLEHQVAVAEAQLTVRRREQEETRVALEQSRRDMEQAQRDLEEQRARVQVSRERVEATRVALEAAAAGGPAEPSAQQMPTGAMLVIQGLAQTRRAREEDSDTGSTSEARTRPRHTRRRSDGTLSSRSTRDADQGPPLEAQARMIGGLLTVAAAATASTLLTPTPARPSPRAQSLTSSVVDFVMNRLRPNRPFNRAVSNIESALGNYLRDVSRNGELELPQSTLEEAPHATTRSTDGDSDVGNVAPPRADFQRFLELMQMDLVAAVREFASPVEQLEVDESLPAPEPSPESAQPPQEGSPVPTFHPQLGQIRPPTASASGITGGADGQARRLNFFRAHVFPARAATVPGQEDASAVVPCIFIGVRSIAHDPSLTTDDLVQHPNFPFTDGQVPSSAGSPPTDDAASLSSTPLPPPGTTARDRRSFRDRVFDRLSLRRSTSRTATPPLNTYLVYVIGGFYPRNHPVLRIPNLITGGPLTDEEMNLIAELMGPGKPPTATSEEIEKSGLRIVGGGDMARLGSEGEVLESCVERCLICLGDFEKEEECRILSCKHGFHKECVDHWLSQGRNNCPACRSEAVTKAPTATETPAPPPPVPAETSEAPTLPLPTVM